MARAKTTQPVSLNPLPDPIEEGNFSRLGLFSVQERIPSTFTSWTRSFESDNVAATFSCTSPAELGGVPHGIDAEFMQAIINLYIENGAPLNGEINVGMREALIRSGCDTSGHYCALLRESLQRMRGALYTANNAWFDKGKTRRVSTTFNLISDLTIIERGSGDDALSTTRIIVRLPPEIIANIRERYTRHLDLRLMASLKRSSSRILYRLLEGRRFDGEMLDVATRDAFKVDLVEWAQELKLVTRESSKVRTLLEGLHEELIRNGFLTSATFEGRGQRASVTYLFANSKSGEDVEAEAKHLENLADAQRILKNYGFNKYWVARHCAEHDISAIRAADATMKAVIAQGLSVRNRTGYFTKILQQPEVFEVAPLGLAVSERRAAPMEEPAVDNDSAISALPRKLQITEVLNRLAYPMMALEIPQTQALRLRSALLGSDLTPLEFKRRMLDHLRAMERVEAQGLVAHIVDFTDLEDEPVSSKRMLDVESKVKIVRNKARM